MCAEVYTTLKEYYMLPKLRKEHLYLENEMNSLLQTHMYDFIYDQQDLYEYYDQFLNTNNKKNKNTKKLSLSLKSNSTTVIPKNEDFPFSSLLVNFELVIGEFFEEQDIKAFAEYRWYNSANTNILTNEKMFK